MTAETANPWDSRQAALAYDRIYADGEDIPLLLELASRAGGPILEVGCGTGRCLVPFVRAGYDTVGLDRSAAMLDILKTKLAPEPDEIMHRATPLQGDGRDFAIPLRFGMAFIGRDSYCHFVTKEEQEAFGSTVFQHLRAGGILVLDLFNPDVRRLADPVAEIREDGDLTLRQTVTETNFATQLMWLETVIERRGVEVDRVRWPFRYSFRFELEHLLEKLGFEIANVWGDYERGDFVDGSKRLIMVARKPPEADMTVVQFMQAAVAERT